MIPRWEKYARGERTCRIHKSFSHAPKHARLASPLPLRSDKPVFRWINNRRVVHVVIVALFLVPMIGLVEIVPNKAQPFLSKVKLWFDGLEYSTIDYRIQFGRKAVADPQIVLLSIGAPSISLDALDDQTIAASPSLSLIKQNGFPFPRNVYADTCERLFSAGAKTVSFDIFFRSITPSDAAFAGVLDKYRTQVIVGLNFSDEASSTIYCNLPAASLIPSQDTMDDRLGYLNFWKDTTETTVRSAQYRDNLVYANGDPGAEKSPLLYSLAARTVQRAGHGILIPNDLQARPLRFAGPSRFATFPFYTIFVAKDWESTFQNGAYFRDKIVVIGPVGDWSKDSFLTPLGEIPGVEIHLNAINSLLHNEFLASASDTLVLSSVIGAGLISLLLGVMITEIGWRFLAALIVVGGYAVTAFLLFNGPGWLLPVVAPLGVFGGATGTGYIYDFVLTQIEKLRLRATFERYNSKNVVKFLLENTESYNEMLAGKRRPIVALFSDVRGFTTMAESADPYALVSRLNEYLTAMVDCLFRFDGTLDCFMGDGIMAVWGNTPYDFGPQEDAARGVRCALAMIVELRKLNAKWLSEGKSEWRVGIGLNYGQVIVGDIGSLTNKRFATIGDPVNLASRIEGLTKEYKVEILIGETVADLVRDKFYLRSIDLVVVKGKTKPVEVFNVVGEKTVELSPMNQRFLPLYEEGIRLFRAHEFARAREQFEQALQVVPGDHMSEEYLKSCLAYIEEPPGADWTGVRVMKTK
jgi:adenylate cyclase